MYRLLDFLLGGFGCEFGELLVRVLAGLPSSLVAMISPSMLSGEKAEPERVVADAAEKALGEVATGFQVNGLYRSRG